MAIHVETVTFELKQPATAFIESLGNPSADANGIFKWNCRRGEGEASAIDEFVSRAEACIGDDWQDTIVLRRSSGV